jgi:hypothetical protein
VLAIGEEGADGLLLLLLLLSNSMSFSEEL